MASAARRLRLMTLAGFLLAKAAFCAGQSPSLVHLVKGRGVPMCEAYFHEIDRTVGDAPISSICRHNGKFLSPQFQHPPQGPQLELTVTDRLENNAAGRLMRQIIDFTWKHDANPAFYFDATALDTWRGTPLQLKAARRSFTTVFSDYESANGGGYSTVLADVDNDGTPETVLYFPQCPGGGLTMAAPLVLSHDLKSVGAPLTLRVLRDPIRGRVSSEAVRPVKDVYVFHGLTAVADTFRSSSFGIFSYGGRTYFDFWWSAPPGHLPDVRTGTQVQVFDVSPTKTTEICTYAVQDP